MHFSCTYIEVMLRICVVLYNSSSICIIDAVRVGFLDVCFVSGLLVNVV